MSQDTATSTSKPTVIADLSKLSTGEIIDLDDKTFDELIEGPGLSVARMTDLIHHSSRMSDSKRRKLQKKLAGAPNPPFMDGKARRQ